MRRNPQLGRFLGVDPLAADGGQDMFSPYAAMGNAPESMVDPNGTQYRSPNGYQNVKEIGGDAARRNSPVQDIFSGGGNGGGFNLSGSEGVVTLYGTNAQNFWAWHIGSKSTQGSGKTPDNFSVDGDGLGTGEGLVPANAIGVSNNGTSSVYKWYTGSIEDLELHSITILNSQPEKEKGVGEPGLTEGFIPIWGSGRAAINDFQNGRWGWGIFNTVMAVSDVFLVKTLYTGIAKAGVMGVGKLSMESAKGVQKTSGWVARSVFNSLDGAVQKKAAAAIAKGIVAPKGKNGIIRLTASEAAETGYQFKIKILGKGGDTRIYSNPMKNGHILFDKIMGH